MNQIKQNREKILIKKLYEKSIILYSENVLLGQNPVLQGQNQGQNPVLQGQNSLTNYDMPMPFMPSFVITVFIVEVSIIICIIFFIVQKVNYIYNQENK
jgi:CO dehydrogenase/acetyl-CoA synthase delta subunit